MKKTSLLISFLLIILVVKESYTNSGGPQQNNVGAPGGGNCTSCHSGTAQTNAPELSLTVTQSGTPVTSITAGQTYNLTFTITTSGPRFGFQMAARNPSNNLPAGTFSAGTGTAINGAYINQNSQGTTSTTGQGRSWSFNWTAPATAGFGNITFYSSGLRANQNGQNSGDVTYLRSFNFPEATVVQANITPNTVTTSACDSGQISFEFSTTGTFNSNNVFQLQMSDNFGNFTNTTPLSTISGTGGNNLMFTAALGAITTGNYLLRVVSTNPVVTSNNRQIAISQLVAPIIFRFTNSYSITNPAPNHTYQWFKNGTIVPNAAGTNFTPGVFGTYYARASNANCPTRFLYSNIDTLFPTVTGFNPVSVCSPSNVSGPVPISGGDFDQGNVLSVELSDASGQFPASPIIVHSSVVTIIPPSIGAVFPAGLTPSSNYRMRFRSTQPIWLSQPSAPFSMLTTPAKPTVTRVLDTLVSSSTTGNQWYRLGQGAIPNATGQKYLPAQNGQYWVLVSNGTCASPISDTLAFVGTSVQEIGNGAMLYPNPARESFVLEGSNPMETEQLAMFDLNGRKLSPVMIQETSNRIRIQIENLPSGLYMLNYLNQRIKVVVTH